MGGNPCAVLCSARSRSSARMRRRAAPSPAAVRGHFSLARERRSPGARAAANNLLVQYFVNYNLPEGWYLTSAPIITANWEASSGNKWVVPFGGGIGKILRIAKLPFNGGVSAFYNAVKPDVGPDWTLRIQLALLLPKSVL